jgi:hypothetical protein
MRDVFHPELRRAVERDVHRMRALQLVVERIVARARAAGHHHSAAARCGPRRLTVRSNALLGVTAARYLGGRLKQPGRQLHEWVRHSGKVQGLDETLCGADFSCRSCPEESAQLVMHRCTAVLRHGLEASKRVELGLSLEHTLYGLGSQCPDQLVLEIGYAREEAEGFKGLVGGDRNGHVGECAADVPLVGDVVHATEVCTWVCAHEVRKHP